MRNVFSPPGFPLHIAAVMVGGLLLYGCGSDSLPNADDRDPNQTNNPRVPPANKPADPPGPTGLKGTILETNSEQPIAGLTVSVGNDSVGWVHAVTDANGVFEAMEISENSTLIRMDGASVAIANRTYPTVTTQLHAAWLVAHEVTEIPESKYLPDISTSPATDLSMKLKPSTDDTNHPAADGWHETTEDILVKGENSDVPGARNGVTGLQLKSTTYAEIKEGAFIKFPEGAPHIITVTQVPVDQLPHALPDYVAPDQMVTFQPAGTLIDPPARLHFGDFRDYATIAPTQEFAVWSLSHSMNLFLRLGEASLDTSAIGPEIVTNPGVGLGELGWHGPSCGTVNFQVDVEYDFDDHTNNPVPHTGTVRMDVLGGGVNGDVTRSATNTGGGINSGNMASCGGFFTFHVGHEEFKIPSQTYSVPNWRCAQNGGTNHIGKITVRKVAGNVTIIDGITLPAC